MIEIKNLAIRNKERSILSGLDLTLVSGDRVGIMGASGIGKSTLVYALLGEIGDGLSLEGGTIEYQGKELMKDGKYLYKEHMRVFRRETGHLDQDPASSLNPGHQIKFILTELAASRGEARKQEIRENLQYFGLPYSEEFLERYPHELSGGQRRRIALTRILLRQPRILILDEPTADLDCGTREDVLQLLARLVERLSATVLLISHDIEVIRRLTERVYSLENGVLHPYYEADANLSEQQMMATSLSAGNKQRKLVLQANKISARAPGATSDTFQNLSFSLCQKEALAIMGPSGSGKTTLLRTILGLWPRSSGTLEYNGEVLAASFKGRTMQQRKALGWVPQDPRGSFNPALPLNLVFSRIKEPSFPISDMLHLVGLTEHDLKDRFPDQLSGGQIQRLAIARALLEGAEVLLLDEITSSLDPKSRDSICELIGLLKKDFTCLVVTHDPTVARYICDRRLDLGKLPRDST